MKRSKFYVANYGSTDEVTFEAFVAQKLVPQLWHSACAVTDNCSIHLAETMRKLIEAAEAHLTYLLPYSSDFSPYRKLLV